MKKQYARLYCPVCKYDMTEILYWSDVTYQTCHLCGIEIKTRPRLCVYREVRDGEDL